MLHLCLELTDHAHTCALRAWGLLCTSIYPCLHTLGGNPTNKCTYKQTRFSRQNFLILRGEALLRICKHIQVLGGMYLVVYCVPYKCCCIANKIVLISNYIPEPHREYTYVCTLVVNKVFHHMHKMGIGNVLGKTIILAKDHLHVRAAMWRWHDTNPGVVCGHDSG